jgi:hypothetical protein
MMQQKVGSWDSIPSLVSLYSVLLHSNSDIKSRNVELSSFFIFAPSLVICAVVALAVPRLKFAQGFLEVSLVGKET